MKQTVTVLLCVLLAAQPAAGWNNTGHKLVAYLAYGQLNAKARAKVDALLQAHPMSAAFNENLGKRVLFAEFATWADAIKGDRQFVDTPRVDVTCKPQGTVKPAPGPVLAGFPDMQRHQDWHYDDVPFSPDGTPTHASCVPNARTQLDMILKDLGSPSVPDAVKSWELPWLEHLVGDVHQPLHAVSRFTALTPKGDAGGNLIRLHDTSNLHSYWDGLAGIVDAEAVIVELSKTVKKMSRKVPTGTPAEWINDSAAVAQAEVYNFTGKGTADDPAKLPDGYKAKARKTAYLRMGMAAQRLADVLNATLGK